MPKILAEAHNNELRREEGYEEKRKDSSKKDFERVKNGYICPPGTKRKCTVRNQVPGSISFVPSVAGLIVAGEVIKDIIKI